MKEDAHRQRERKVGLGESPLPPRSCAAGGERAPHALDHTAIDIRFAIGSSCNDAEAKHETAKDHRPAACRLSSEPKCNTPADLIIGKVDQDLRECWHAMLFAFVG